MTRIEAGGHYAILLSELRALIQQRDAIVDAIRARLQTVKSSAANTIMDFDDTSFLHAVSALNAAQLKVREAVDRVNACARTAELQTINLHNINIAGYV